MPPKLPFRRKATRMRCMGRAPPARRRLRRKVETFVLPRLAPTAGVSGFQDWNGFFPQMHCRFDDIIVRIRKFCKGFRQVSGRRGGFSPIASYWQTNGWQSSDAVNILQRHRRSCSILLCRTQLLSIISVGIEFAGSIISVGCCTCVFTMFKRITTRKYTTRNAHQNFA